MTIRDRVIKVVSKQFGVDEIKIKDSNKFKADLGADSLDIVELIMALENEFNIKIEDDEIEIADDRDITVGELVKFVSLKLKGKVTSTLIKQYKGKK